MPSSVERPRLSSGEDPERAQVASSNQTLNKFLGGPRPLWMTDANNVTRTSALAAAQTTANKGRPRIPPRERARNDFNIQVLTSGPVAGPGTTQTTGLPTPNDICGDEDPQGYQQRGSSVLPSPALTNEASPVTTAYVEAAGAISNSPKVSSHATASHSDVVEPLPSADSFRPDETSSREVLNTQQHNATSQAPQSSVVHRNPSLHVNTAVSHNPAPTNLPTPLQHPKPSHGCTHTGHQKRPAPPSGSATSDSGSKRVCAPQISALPEDWIKRLDARIDTCQGLIAIRQAVEKPRYRMLQDAFARADFFYIILHQYFCLWTLDKSAVHRILPVGADVMDAVFQALLILLRRNEDMTMEHLKWFAEFPGPCGLYMSTVPHYSDIFHHIVNFLKTFSQAWANLGSVIHARRYPILAWEASHALKCPSPILQTTFFTFTRRILWIQDGHFATELNNLFTKDQHQEYRMVRDNLPADVRARVRDGMAVRYSAIIAQAQRSQTDLPSNQSTAHTAVYHNQGAIIAHRPSIPQSNTRLPPLQTTSMPLAVTRPLEAGPRNLMPVSNSPAESQSTGGDATQFPTGSFGHTQCPAPTERHAQASSRSYAPAFYSALQEQQATQQNRMPHEFLQAGASPPSGLRAVPLPVLRRQNETPSPMNAQVPTYAQHNHPYLYSSNHQLSFVSSNAQIVHQPVNSAINNHVPVAQTNSVSATWTNSPGVAAIQSFTGPNVAIGISPNPVHGTRQDSAQYRIPENDYPASPYDWTSVQPSLHLVKLRSPQRAPAQLAPTRYYQFITDFATELEEMSPQRGLRYLDFHVSQANYASLAASRTSEATRIPVATYVNGSCRYRLRLCLFKSGQKVSKGSWTVLPNHWPEHIYVLVNGEPRFPRRRQHFHHDLPIELTDSIRLGKNNVAISLPNVAANTKKGMISYIAVEVVTTLDHDSAVAMVKGTPHIPTEETKREIQKRLQVSESDDIIVEDDSLTISLADPFTSVLYDIPVRGNDCKHLECFDLETWLRTRPTKPSHRGKEPCMVDVWKCPICGLDARPASLRVDDYMADVRTVLLFKSQERTKRVRVDAKGDWTPIVETEDSDDEALDAEDARAVSRPSTKKAVAEVIEILDD